MTNTPTLTGVYNSITDSSEVLDLLSRPLRLRHDLDETILCVNVCLYDCLLDFLKLQKILKDFYEQDDNAKVVECSWKASTRTRLLKLNFIIANIQGRLKPAVYALELNQADTNIATTSGFEKDRTTRHRPLAQQTKAFSRVEAGELADAPSYADSEPHKKHDELEPNTPEAGGQQLGPDPLATRRIAFWRRIPFCYLLAALGLVFISSSSAVGIYYSIAKHAMGDGFTTAGYMLAVGTLVVTPPAAFHYQHCRCWTSYSKIACQEAPV